MSSGIEIPQAHVEHREGFREFVLGAAEDWHRGHLTRLYERWAEWNKRYYGGELTVPHILLAEPSAPSRLGDCAPVSGWGSRSQIRLRPSLLEGTHRIVNGGEAHAEGRARFVEDVLLHEIIHQHAQEISGAREQGYHGHGPVFASICNRIGATLGLSPVRAAKARGKSRDLPSCAQWPWCVRPAAHYLGALAAEDEVEEDLEAHERVRVLELATAKLADAALLYGSGPQSDQGNVSRLLAAATGYSSAIKGKDS